MVPEPLKEIFRTCLATGGILYIRDGNNALDIVGRYRRMKFWRGRECGPVETAGMYGNEIDKAVEGYQAINRYSTSRLSSFATL